MPLKPYQRGKTYWVYGQIEYNGRAITGTYRCSTGSSTEAGARDWIEYETQRQIRCHLVGEEESLTFADAVMLYPAKPAEAAFLLKIVPHIGGDPLTSITPAQARALAPQIYPDAATDTWRRQVLTPISAVINHAHDLGKCPPIRIKGYSSQDRITQDARRGKASRQARDAGSWQWIRQVQPHANPWVSAGLEMMFETGIRVGQLVAIRPRDLDLKACKVWIIAQKGHAAQWIEISPQMMVTLANLKARRPHNRKDGYTLPPLVFGYADRSGFTAALRKACARAGVDYLSPHAAGRHGFYTELRVRQGVDPISAAHAGRWKDPALPDRVYAKANDDQGQMRALIRTNDVQGQTQNTVTELKRKRKSGL